MTKQAEIQKRIDLIRNSNKLAFKDTTGKGLVLKAIKSGRDFNDIINTLDGEVSRGDISWNIKQMYDMLKDKTIKTSKSTIAQSMAKAFKEVKEKKVVKVTKPISADRVKLIPDCKEKYISRRVAGTTDIKLMKSAYDARQNILIIGETGSGKTHLLRHMASEMKVPYMRVNLNGATTPEDLVGQFIPNTDAKSNAKYVWKDGVLTDFIRNGGIFVVDEINMCPADILSILHSVTDDERKIVITQKDGEVIHAHEDFWIVATMNQDYEGTKPLNIALKDRFRTVILSYNPTVERKLTKDKPFLDIVNKLRKSDQISTPVSTRDIIKYTDDCNTHNEAVAQYFFINNFEDVEQPVVSEIIELTLNPKVVNKTTGIVKDDEEGGF